MVLPVTDAISFDKCRWYVYAYEPSESHGILCITALVSMAVTSLFMLTLSRFPSRGWSHLMIVNLSLVCWCRSLLSVFMHVVVPASYDGFIVDSCECIGYLHKVIGAYHVEAITVLSIERYVLAKYYKLGIPVQYNHYNIFFILCLTFTMFYSSLPYLGFGTYLGRWGDVALVTREAPLRCDTMIYKVVYVILQLMQSVKSAALVWYMLYWTYKIENECYGKDSKHYAEKVMSKSVLRVCLVSALCWLPTFLSYIWTVIQLQLKCPLEVPPAGLVMLSSLGLEIAPIATIFTMIATNEYIRSNILKRCMIRTGEKTE